MTGSGSGVSNNSVWGVVLPAVALLVIASAVLFGMEYGLHKLGLSDAVLITLAVISGLVLLLFVIMAMVVVYAKLGMAVRTEALGLPPGSIRAILAFALLAIFVGISVYLISAKKLDNQTAAGLLATVGTLAVSVSAFYFGTSAVKTGASTVAALANVRHPPTADTKGSEPGAPTGWRLIGFVNPSGAETRSYFEHGATEGHYDGSTEVQMLSAGTTTQRVTAETELPAGTYFRIVAHSENGQAIGRPDRIPDNGSATETDGKPPGRSGGNAGQPPEVPAAEGGQPPEVPAAEGGQPPEVPAAEGGQPPDVPTVEGEQKPDDPAGDVHA